MPHKPLFVEDERKGTSKGGLYGDIIEHIDWSVGEVIKALKANGHFYPLFSTLRIMALPKEPVEVRANCAV